MKEKKFDIIALGRATVDINPEDFSRTFVESERFNKYVGGSSANTSVGLAKLGIKVGFIGCVSDDSLGDFVVDYFESFGIDTTHITRAQKDCMLGLAFTEVKDGKTNLMMYRDENVADLQLKSEDIDEEYIASAEYLLVNGTALSASPSREAALRAITLAKKNDVKVIFDIDYRPQVWKDFNEISIYCSLAAREADIIQGSREEFDLMEYSFVKGLDDKQSAERMFEMGAKIVIIKHGAEGSYIFTKDEGTYKVLPFKVNLLKATGGGDGYSSAFLSGMIKGKSIEECAERGTASASIAVASASCSSSFPDEDGLYKFIEEKHAEGQRVIFKMGE